MFDAKKFAYFLGHLLLIVAYIIKIQYEERHAKCTTSQYYMLVITSDEGIGRQCQKFFWREMDDFRNIRIFL